MIEASLWGCWIVLYKNRLIFYYEVEKKTKKHKVDFFLSSTSWLVMMTPVMRHTGSTLEDWSVTDEADSLDFMLPVCALCVLGVILTGRTTDSPLGGAALRHKKPTVV